jgi:hypothetical protein
MIANGTLIHCISQPNRPSLPAVPLLRQRQADADESPRQIIDRRIEALATDIVRDDDPGEMAAYVLTRLRKVLDYRFELLFSRFRLPDIDGLAEAERLAFLETITGGRDSS